MSRAPVRNCGHTTVPELLEARFAASRLGDLGVR
jgi:hypothetical protein